MRIIDLILNEFRRIKKQRQCKHYYMRTKVIFGDMVNTLGYCSVWHCVICEKRKVSKYRDKI